VTTSTTGLAALSRADLCTLGREIMLAGHLQDRASVPAVLREHTMDEAYQLSIDEWMTASPIYTQRLQQLLGCAGDDVPTIFKGLQLDIGFAHQFMDVGYRLQDERRGEFWLRSCGALADVVPMGEPFVQGMCHDIEDPTFDATAVATNPRARVRPVHRPPGVPRGGPDCHWTVTIDPDAEPTLPHPELASLETSVVANVPNDPGPAPAGTAGGWDDYSGPFDPSFELENLSHRALQIVVREFAVQGHLLARALMCAIERRHNQDEAVAVGRALFTGIGWITSERIARALGVDAADPAALSTVLPLTSLLLPADYVGVTVDTDDVGVTTIALSGEAGGLGEGDPYSLPGLLDLGADEIIESLVHGVDRAATVTETDVAGAVRAWTVEAGSGESADEPDVVTVTRFSTGVEVTLRRRVPVPS
jgi:hypothetical protein